VTSLASPTRPVLGTYWDRQTISITTSGR